MTSNERFVGSREGQGTQSRRHSGLSALIQAATSQLGHSFDVYKEQDTSVIDDAFQDRSETNWLSNKLSMDANETLSTRMRFPEILMTLASDRNNEDVITFLPDGKFLAIRVDEFSKDIMKRYFSVSVFEDFLGIADDWGFSCVFGHDNSIQILRHPLLIEGHWGKCSQIKFGISPADARLSALPIRVKEVLALSESTLADLSVGKRRLSPGFIAQKDSESPSTSQRRKSDDAPEIGSSASRGEADDEEGSSTIVSLRAPVDSSAAKTSYTSKCRHDELRSFALSITTSELKLCSSGSDSLSPSSSTSHPLRSPLVDLAVESATLTIVTDAIETLLRDKEHTMTTYLKHEATLSHSSLPGVVPLSKQLFSPDSASWHAPNRPCPSPEPRQVITDEEQDALE
jgi:hypothetical protein